MVQQNREYRFLGRLVLALIAPGATRSRVKAFLSWVKQYPFPAVFVDMTRLSQARELLGDSSVSLGAPIAHPFGWMDSVVKSRYIRQAAADGADEVDVGLDYMSAKSHDFKGTAEEVRVLTTENDERTQLVFVPQLAILSDEEKLAMCEAILLGGGHRICTSWGYGWNTSVSDVLLLASEFGDDLKIEAGGGIRIPEQAQQMLDAGAVRIHSGSPALLLKADGIDPACSQSRHE